MAELVRVLLQDPCHAMLRISPLRVVNFRFVLDPSFLHIFLAKILQTVLFHAVVPSLLPADLRARPLHAAQLHVVQLYVVTQLHHSIFYGTNELF